MVPVMVALYLFKNKRRNLDEDNASCNWWRGHRQPAFACAWIKPTPPAAESPLAQFAMRIQTRFGEVLLRSMRFSQAAARFEATKSSSIRCVYVGGDLQPETVPDGNALVLGVIDQRLADFNCFGKPDGYRTAIGINVCCWAVVSRHNTLP